MGLKYFTFILILLLASLATPACAETYSWTDAEGMHFTDNPESIPKKYRKKALSEARDKAKDPGPVVIDINEHPELVISSQPAKERHRGPVKAKQFRRGQRLAASETVGMDKRDGCYLSYSVQPGPGYHWNPNAHSTGAMKMNVSTEADCLQDCNDNAQQQALSKARGWQVLGSCYYNGQILTSDISF